MDGIKWAPCVLLSKVLSISVITLIVCCHEAIIVVKATSQVPCVAAQVSLIVPTVWVMNCSNVLSDVVVDVTHLGGALELDVWAPFDRIVFNGTSPLHSLYVRVFLNDLVGQILVDAELHTFTLTMSVGVTFNGAKTSFATFGPSVKVVGQINIALGSFVALKNSTALVSVNQSTAGFVVSVTSDGAIFIVNELPNAAFTGLISVENAASVTVEMGFSSTFFLMSLEGPLQAVPTVALILFRNASLSTFAITYVDPVNGMISLKKCSAMIISVSSSIHNSSMTISTTQVSSNLQSAFVWCVDTEVSWLDVAVQELTLWSATQSSLLHFEGSNNGNSTFIILGLNLTLLRNPTPLWISANIIDLVAPQRSTTHVKLVNATIVISQCAFNMWSVTRGWLIAAIGSNAVLDMLNVVRIEFVNLVVRDVVKGDKIDVRLFSGSTWDNRSMVYLNDVCSQPTVNGITLTDNSGTTIATLPFTNGCGLAGVPSSCIVPLCNTNVFTCSPSLPSSAVMTFDISSDGVFVVNCSASTEVVVHINDTISFVQLHVVSAIASLRIQGLNNSNTVLSIIDESSIIQIFNSDPVYLIDGVQIGSFYASFRGKYVLMGTLLRISMPPAIEQRISFELGSSVDLSPSGPAVIVENQFPSGNTTITVLASLVIKRVFVVLSSSVLANITVTFNSTNRGLMQTLTGLSCLPDAVPALLLLNIQQTGASNSYASLTVNIFDSILFALTCGSILQIVNGPLIRSFIIIKNVNFVTTMLPTVALGIITLENASVISSSFDIRSSTLAFPQTILASFFSNASSLPVGFIGSTISFTDCTLTAGPSFYASILSFGGSKNVSVSSSRIVLNGGSVTRPAVDGWLIKPFNSTSASAPHISVTNGTIVSLSSTAFSLMNPLQSAKLFVGGGSWSNDSIVTVDTCDVSNISYYVINGSVPSSQIMSSSCLSCLAPQVVISFPGTYTFNCSSQSAPPLMPSFSIVINISSSLPLSKLGGVTLNITTPFASLSIYGSVSFVQIIVCCGALQNVSTWWPMDASPMRSLIVVQPTDIPDVFFVFTSTVPGIHSFYSRNRTSYLPWIDVTPSNASTVEFLFDQGPVTLSNIGRFIQINPRTTNATVLVTWMEPLSVSGNITAAASDNTPAAFVFFNDSGPGASTSASSTLGVRVQDSVIIQGGAALFFAPNTSFTNIDITITGITQGTSAWTVDHAAVFWFAGNVQFVKLSAYSMDLFVAGGCLLCMGTPTFSSGVVGRVVQAALSFSSSIVRIQMITSDAVLSTISSSNIVSAIQNASVVDLTGYFQELVVISTQSACIAHGRPWISVVHHYLAAAAPPVAPLAWVIVSDTSFLSTTNSGVLINITFVGGSESSSNTSFVTDVRIGWMSTFSNVSAFNYSTIMALNHCCNSTSVSNCPRSLLVAVVNGSNVFIENHSSFCITDGLDVNIQLVAGTQLVVRNSSSAIHSAVVPGSFQHLQDNISVLPITTKDAVFVMSINFVAVSWCSLYVETLSQLFKVEGVGASYVAFDTFTLRNADIQLGSRSTLVSTSLCNVTLSQASITDSSLVVGPLASVVTLTNISAANDIGIGRSNMLFNSNLTFSNSTVLFAATTGQIFEVVMVNATMAQVELSFTDTSVAFSVRRTVGWVIQVQTCSSPSTNFVDVTFSFAKTSFAASPSLWANGVALLNQSLALTAPLITCGTALMSALPSSMQVVIADCRSNVVWNATTSATGDIISDTAALMVPFQPALQFNVPQVNIVGAEVCPVCAPLLNVTTDGVTVIDCDLPELQIFICPSNVSHKVEVYVNSNFTNITICGSADQMYVFVRGDTNQVDVTHSPLRVLCTNITELSIVFNRSLWLETSFLSPSTCYTSLVSVESAPNAIFSVQFLKNVHVFNCVTSIIHFISVGMPRQVLIQFVAALMSLSKGGITPPFASPTQSLLSYQSLQTTTIHITITQSSQVQLKGNAVAMVFASGSVSFADTLDITVMSNSSLIVQSMATGLSFASASANISTLLLRISDSQVMLDQALPLISLSGTIFNCNITISGRSNISLSVPSSVAVVPSLVFANIVTTMKLALRPATTTSSIVASNISISGVAQRWHALVGAITVSSSNTIIDPQVTVTLSYGGFIMANNAISLVTIECNGTVEASHGFFCLSTAGNVSVLGLRFYQSSVDFRYSDAITVGGDAWIMPVYWRRSSVVDIVDSNLFLNDQSTLLVSSTSAPVDTMIYVSIRSSNVSLSHSSYASQGAAVAIEVSRGCNVTFEASSSMCAIATSGAMPLFVMLNINASYLNIRSQSSLVFGGILSVNLTISASSTVYVFDTSSVICVQNFPTTASVVSITLSSITVQEWSSVVLVRSTFISLISNPGVVFSTVTTLFKNSVIQVFVDPIERTRPWFMMASSVSYANAIKNSVVVLSNFTLLHDDIQTSQPAYFGGTGLLFTVIWEPSVVVNLKGCNYVCSSQNCVGSRRIMEGADFVGVPLDAIVEDPSSSVGCSNCDLELTLYRDAGQYTFNCSQNQSRLIVNSTNASAVIELIIASPITSLNISGAGRVINVIFLSGCTQVGDVNGQQGVFIISNVTIEVLHVFIAANVRVAAASSFLIISPNSYPSELLNITLSELSARVSIAALGNFIIFGSVGAIDTARLILVAMRTSRMFFGSQAQLLVISGNVSNIDISFSIEDGSTLDVPQSTTLVKCEGPFMDKVTVAVVMGSINIQLGSLVKAALVKHTMDTTLNLHFIAHNVSLSCVDVLVYTFGNSESSLLVSWVNVTAIVGSAIASTGGTYSHNTFHMNNVSLTGGIFQTARPNYVVVEITHSTIRSVATALIDVSYSGAFTGPLLFPVIFLSMTNSLLTLSSSHVMVVTLCAGTYLLLKDSVVTLTAASSLVYSTNNLDNSTVVMNNSNLTLSQWSSVVHFDALRWVNISNLSLQFTSHANITTGSASSIQRCTSSCGLHNSTFSFDGDVTLTFGNASEDKIFTAVSLTQCLFISTRITFSFLSTPPGLLVPNALTTEAEPSWNATECFMVQDPSSSKPFLSPPRAGLMFPSWFVQSPVHVCSSESKTVPTSTLTNALSISKHFQTASASQLAVSTRISTSASHTITLVVTQSAALQSRSSSMSPTSSQALPVVASVVPRAFPIATQSIAMFAGVAAASFGFTVQRAGLDLRLLACDLSLDDAPDIPTSPTQMSLGRDEQRYQRGTVIGNACILIGIAALCALLSGMRKWSLMKRRGVEITWWRGAASLRLPGWLVVFWSFLLQPLIAAIACVLMHPTVGVDIAIGGVVLLMIVFMLGMEVRLLVFRFHAIRRRVRRPTKSISNSWLHKLLARCEGEGDEFAWCDSDNETEHFIKHYGPIFEMYRHGAHTFHLVDSLFAVVTGVLQAVATVYHSSGCSAMLYTLCVLQILYFLLVVLWRPHAATAEWIVAAVMASLGAGFGALVLIPSCDVCDSVAVGLAQGQVYFAFADLCLSLVKVLRSGRVKRFLIRLLDARLESSSESKDPDVDLGTARPQANSPAEKLSSFPSRSRASADLRQRVASARHQLSMMIRDPDQHRRLMVLKGLIERICTKTLREDRQTMSHLQQSPSV